MLEAHLRHKADGDMVEPSEQNVHSDTEAAATTGRNLPAGQALHDSEAYATGHAEQFDAPVIPAYLPTSQLEHVADEVAPSSCEYLPLSHSMHALSEPAPATPECLPAAHLTQDVSEAAPSNVKYLPLAQATQLVDPALSA